jgi:ferredoxin
MIPKVDQEKCIGCGVCVALASKTFRFNDNGKAEVYESNGDDLDNIKSAVDSCPVQAITVE